MEVFEYKNIKVEWLGHASFKISNNLKIYIDPYDLKNEQEKADLIFITHEHYDHCSISDIKKIVKEDSYWMVIQELLLRQNSSTTF